MDNEYIYGKNDLFALFIIFKCVLKECEFQDLALEIEDNINNLDYNLKTIPVSKILDRMGFPGNWKELTTIGKKELF